MKNKIGFIAVGQAGGNIGSRLEALGYNVIFLNTSEEDLSTLNTKFRYHINGGEGCNKDRNKAKDLVINDFENISKEIEEKLNKDFIYVIFSSGGGTGSGASPMLMDLLIQHMNKKVGAITIIPSEKEPLKTHINAYECFREIEAIEGICSTIILDNNACENKLCINKDFTELFEKMLDMPNHKDIRGNIDKAEVMELISSRGMLMITKVDKAETTVAKVIDGIKNNIYAPIENDKVIKYLGIITAKPVDFNEVKKEVGNFLDVFHGYGEDTVCVLAGLSLPFKRLENMKEIVVANQDTVKRNLQATNGIKLDQDINFLDSVVTTKKSTSNAKNDIFSKYRKK
ncbi:hypothetical protein [Cellulosilyticum sp. I15G10I2]|uniref:hypothetical protein n=1 Tax=Cellulosilyticum sp. I15G10I2 TaxID=1892843 RepID=UPI00085C2158|nr:hypothetical protein [Cellulosilyticum sp. I15G10I2]